MSACPSTYAPIGRFSLSIPVKEHYCPLCYSCARQLTFLLKVLGLLFTDCTLDHDLIEFLVYLVIIPKPTSLHVQLLFITRRCCAKSETGWCPAVPVKSQVNVLLSLYSECAKQLELPLVNRLTGKLPVNHRKSGTYVVYILNVVNRFTE